MGRRYLSADYADVVRRVREAVPGAAVHADAIVGFPTEDGAAWRRSIDFIRSLELAGVHVFRYSQRPGTAAVRMRGHVDEAVKKHRAAELLALAAEARAAWAAAHVDTDADVLFESRLEHGQWVGHAADHTLVAAAPPEASSPLENHIGRVRVDAVDPAMPDRVLGRILSLSSPSTEAAADAS
jgi:threonylcarbamoyladenosine tRNA methylthiotransferase MtaB